MPHPPGAFPLLSWFRARLVSSREGGLLLKGGCASRTASKSPRNSRPWGIHTMNLLKVANLSGPNLRFSRQCPAISRSRQCRARPAKPRGGGLEERNVRILLQVGRESVDHQWLSAVSQTPRTCATLSLLAACTASCLSSRYCPVLHSSQALRLSSRVFRVSLVRKLLGVPAVSRRQHSGTLKTLVLKSVQNFSGSVESLGSSRFSASSLSYTWATLSFGAGGHPAELG